MRPTKFGYFVRFPLSKTHQNILNHRIRRSGIRKKEVYKSVMFVYSGKEEKLIKADEHNERVTVRTRGYEGKYFILS